MRNGISTSVSSADRRRLKAIIADRIVSQKHVWRARIILLTADCLGTNAIMAATKVIQAILDNDAADKTPELRRWLARHPR